MNLIKTTMVFVATHKEFNQIADKDYIPVMCGAIGRENDFGYRRDDDGENISSKNERFCEITALYWMWKNIRADYIGLVHYRRYFVKKKGKPISSEQISRILSEYDIILPDKRHYFIETIRSHYCHSHYEKDLKAAEETVKRLSPEYSIAMEKVLKSRSAYICNMFITRYELFEKYCEWLFPILFELDKAIDVSDYDSFNKRVIGFLSERLFNVWIEKNKPNAVELSVYCTENQKKIKKYTDFVIRKIKGRR